MRLQTTDDQAALLRAFVPAIVEGAGGAVADPGWSPDLLERARHDLAAAEVPEGWMVLFTSGSTGRPRGVVRTTASWNDAQPAFGDCVPLGDGDVVWTPGPLWSGLFLWGAWHGVHRGVPVLTRDDDPVAATCAFCVPAQVGGLLADLTAGRLPRLHTVVLGGDALDRRRREALRARGVRVVEYYGAAELSLVAIADDAERGYRPFPGVELRVADGRVECATPFAARGYLRDDPAAPLTRDGRWLGVGDFGELTGGRLVVRGRGTSAVNVGGHTVIAEDVERWLTGLDGVTDAAVVGLANPRLGQTLAAAVAGTLDVDALRAASVALPRASRPRRWRVVDAVPRTPAGKVDRARAAELFRDAS
ncbi:class I adenylate-forming enzyme family protein [Nigerium massiliense]|uniref:class I adenylate-forming enzyme family protein n=1 Tax=Nigerium massiliense TaxID=1522317 RepID=UPI0006949F13|nr:fatty acid--CoA ligase family protein [Nigerium massiliense]